jgi:hypothetical protein
MRDGNARGMTEEHRTPAWLRPISGIACGLGIVAIWLSVMWVLWNYLLSLFP